MTFSKTEDELLLALGILKKLKVFDISTLNKRIKLQKIHYLAQAFKLTIPYTFNLYVHGPYSPKLASDVYQAKDEKIAVKEISFATPELKERYEKFQSLLDQTGDDTRKLELIATLHWLNRTIGFDKAKAKEKLIELKGASQQEYITAEKLLKEIPLA